MELILWRHAEAEEGTPDSTRKLTAKGNKQAQLMAEWLKPRLPEHTRIIVSPTKRTQQTAIALDNEFETIADIGPGASAESVLTVAGWPQAKDAVLVVGHQPTLGDVASLLMSGVPRAGACEKAPCGGSATRKKGLSSDLVLRTVISPDML